MTVTDRLIAAADDALRTLTPGTGTARRAAPVEGKVRGTLGPGETAQVHGLMRVNHTGEVCAQALYEGQSLTARSAELKQHLRQACEEERDHLAWCDQMLEETGGRPSLLNPLWYAGSYGMGALAGLAGDRWSLGFLVETERQVEAHLDDHLERLPAADERSRAVLETMKEEEAGHAGDAEAAGAHPLPEWLKRLMSATAAVMKAVAYRI